MNDTPSAPSISVVVPVRNARATVHDCLDALLTQDAPGLDYEVIAVDNASTDGWTDSLRSHPRLTVLHERSRGAYAARNCGLEAARGEIIAFTDPDCIPAPNWLAEVQASLVEHDVLITIGRHTFARSGKWLDLLQTYEEEKKRYTFSSGIPILYHGHNNNMAVRRSVFAELGPYLVRSRGSDTILVRHCIDAHGTAAVRYWPGMVVQHLEIDSVRKYYDKCAVYRSSRRDYRGLVRVRGLTTAERWHVYVSTVRRRRIHFIDSVGLLVILVSGLACCSIRGRLLPTPEKA